MDGILLDAPEVYDGITDDIINESIIKVLNRRGILTNAEELQILKNGLAGLILN